MTILIASSPLCLPRNFCTSWLPYASARARSTSVFFVLAAQSGVRFPLEARVVSPYYNVETGLGLTQLSIQRVPRVKWPRPEVGRSPPSNDECCNWDVTLYCASVAPWFAVSLVVCSTNPETASRPTQTRSPGTPLPYVLLDLRYKREELYRDVTHCPCVFTASRIILVSNSM